MKRVIIDINDNDVVGQVLSVSLALVTTDGELRLGSRSVELTSELEYIAFNNDADSVTMDEVTG